jgi:hypothetical protein
MENPKTPIKKVINKNNTLRMPRISSGSLGGSSGSGRVFQLLLRAPSEPFIAQPAPSEEPFTGEHHLQIDLPASQSRDFSSESPSALVFALKFNRTTILAQKTLLTSLCFFTRSSRKGSAKVFRFRFLSPRSAQWSDEKRSLGC